MNPETSSSLFSLLTVNVDDEEPGAARHGANVRALTRAATFL